MKYIPLLICILFINLTGQQMNTMILPTPQQLSITDGSLQLSKITAINMPEKDERLAHLKSILSDALKNAGVSLSNDAGNTAAIAFEIVESEVLTAEGVPQEYINEAYLLNITNKGIIVKAADAKGLFYGGMSILQLIENSSDRIVPCLSVVDYPDMEFRGISDDISRGQVSTLENFKRIIRFIARYKMNTYMLYMEDMLLFDEYPSIGKDRGALTDEEVKELVAYAYNYFVDVIPVFQTLGHYDIILADENFLHLAEFPGSASLRVDYDSTYLFLETVLEKVCRLFPSQYINIGADESYDVGKGANLDNLKEYGTAKLHADHYKRVFKICKKNGKKVMMYGDVLLHHPEILEMIPNDVIIVDWHYGLTHQYSSAKKFDDAGFEYIVSPAVWNFTSTFPVNYLALPNIEYLTRSGIEHNALGMLNSNWGDFGAETIKELILYGYAYSAECSWNFEAADPNSFTHLFFKDFFGVSDTRLPFRIYERMSNCFNQTLWHAFWRHPLLPFREARWWYPNLSPIAQLTWMDLTMPEVIADINELQKVAKRNKDHLDILLFVVELNNWYRDKIGLQILYFEKMDGLDRDSEELIEMTEDFIIDTEHLKMGFRDVWLKYYKKANLNLIEDKFDRMIAYLREAITMLEEDKLKDPSLPNPFLYAYADDTTAVAEAEFYKTFTLGKKPETALLQMIADTYAELFINGKYVDKIFVRRSLSLPPEKKRVLFMDAASYLQEGENTISVKVRNYNLPVDEQEGYLTGHPAALNIITNIQAEDGLLQTDSTWLVKYGGVSDVKPKTDKYRYEIVGPDFETRRQSWIER